MRQDETLGILIAITIFITLVFVHPWYWFNKGFEAGQASLVYTFPTCPEVYKNVEGAIYQSSRWYQFVDLYNGKALDIGVISQYKFPVPQKDKEVSFTFPTNLDWKPHHAKVCPTHEYNDLEMTWEDVGFYTQVDEDEKNFKTLTIRPDHEPEDKFVVVDIYFEHTGERLELNYEVSD